MPAESSNVELLLADADWVRGLARRLVDDVALAEDAVQEAWVAALERGPRHATNLRGWLAAVTRNAVKKRRRGDERRGARERVVAHAEEVPSTFDVVERFSTHHAVASAVLRLEEPYRQTVLLRFYRSMTLGEIATRMGVAPTTVEGRLQRGLAKLRRELERELGGDGRWVRALLPLAGSRSLATGGLAPVVPLSFAAKALVLGGALLLLGLALRATLPPDGTAPVTHPLAAGGPVPTPDDTVERSTHEGDPSPGEVAFRERRTVGETAAKAAAPSARGEGSLLVRVHGPDGDPAAEVVVQAWPEETPRAAPLPPPVRTAGDGAALFPRLTAGRWLVEPDRGPRERVHVIAGEDVRVTLALSRGPELVGRVVDADGAPVPRAEVWLSAREPEVRAGARAVASFVETAPAAVTDAAGEFRIANAGGARRIGARAPGFAPSPAAEIVRAGLARVELQLALRGRGGAVSGRVAGPDGESIAGAPVFLDAAGEDAHELVVRTAADGSFRFASVLPGERKLRARAPGLALARRSIAVRAGEELDVELRPDRGMTAFGTVTAADGAPAEGVLIFGASRRWTTSPDLRHATVARTDAAGRYELAGLPEGACWLTFEGGRRGRLEEMLVAEDDLPVRLDVELATGTELAGRVVDEAGEGIAGCVVHAFAEGRGSSARTDADGAFLFPNCEADAYRVTVDERGVRVVAADVVPERGAVRLVAPESLRPRARMAGVAVDAAGAAQVVALRLEDLATGARVLVAVEDLGGGAFRSAPAPAGRYRVQLEAREHPGLLLDGDLVLAAGAVVDLGRQELPPVGTVELSFADAPATELQLRFADAAGRTLRRLRTTPRAGQPLALALAAGRSTLFVSGEGLRPERVDVVVVAGEIARHEVRLQPGLPRPLCFHRGDGATFGRLALTVRDAGGDLVFADELRPHAGGSCAFRARLCLAPGEYAFEAGAPSGGPRASGTFLVPASSSTRGPARSLSFPLR